jgi:drug/metabolite transporter (DMT)-like permease
LLQQNTKAHLALLGTNIFFAVNLTAIKYIIYGGFAKPFAINIIRVGVSAILFWALYFFKPVKSVVKKRDIARFALCALTGIAINQLFFVKGLSLTYSVHAVLLMLTTPILITIFAVWVLKERLNNLKIAGLLLGITGAVILVTSKENSGFATNVFQGDLLVLLNAVAYTFYFILVKPLMKNYNPVAIMRIIFTTGFFMMLPFCLQEFNEIKWQAFTPLAWLNLCLVAFTGTFLAYLWNVYGIKILGASVAGSYIYLQPFFAAVIAYIFMGERITANKMIAAACIFLGVYCCNKKINAAQNKKADN